jgi:hypothetical protein
MADRLLVQVIGWLDLNEARLSSRFGKLPHQRGVNSATRVRISRSLK